LAFLISCSFSFWISPCLFCASIASIASASGLSDLMN
jgi:hypothetical protein